MRCHRVPPIWARIGVSLMCACCLSACSKSRPAPKSAESQADGKSQTVVKRDVEHPSPVLQLQVGQKFPLQKTVTTTLIQPSPSGPQRSTVHKEFLLTVTVEELPQAGELAGQRKMGVKFDSVR